MRKLAVVTALLAGAVVLPSAAQAQQRRCLVTAQSAPATANYDPFNPSSLTINNLAIVFTRAASPGGDKAATIDFYVRAQNSNANGTQLIPISVVGAGSATGLNQNIFYNTPGTVPNITVPLPNSPIPGVLRWDYNGNNAASDVFTVTFTVQLPANLNLTASTSLVFDIEYGCDGTGGGPPFSERNVATNAFTLNINVLSGLQASFIGPALDFGEVGDKTDVDVANPLVGVRTGNVRVASSGPYNVALSSANAYRMTYSGGSAGNETQNLRYSLNFLGQTRNPGDLTPITFATCERAGLGSPPLAGGRNLPVTATLLEGGTDETPSPNYRDELTVTLSPVVAPTGTPGGVTP
jgi:hypothetical protein